MLEDKWDGQLIDEFKNDYNRESIILYDPLFFCFSYEQFSAPLMRNSF